MASSYNPDRAEVYDDPNDVKCVLATFSFFRHVLAVLLTDLGAMISIPNHRVTFERMTQIPHATKFYIKKEDHTFGNIIRMCAPKKSPIFFFGFFRRLPGFLNTSLRFRMDFRMEKTSFFDARRLSAIVLCVSTVVRSEAISSPRSKNILEFLFTSFITFRSFIFVHAIVKFINRSAPRLPRLAHLPSPHDSGRAASKFYHIIIPE
jgi:hypothetical protein